MNTRGQRKRRNNHKKASHAHNRDNGRKTLLFLKKLRETEK